MNEEKRTKKWTRYIAIVFSVLFISMGLVDGNFWLVLCGLSILPSLVLKLKENFNYTNETKWIVFAILFIVGMATTDTQALPDNTANNYNTAVAVSSNSVLENITENNVIENTNTTENTISNTTNTNEIENEITNNTAIENTIDVENTVTEDTENTSVENTTIEKETTAKTSAQKKVSEPSLQASSTQTQETKPATTQTKQAPVTTPNSATVYITDTGSKYHRDGCQYLRKSKHAISLDSATAQGYSPCSRCY